MSATIRVVDVLDLSTGNEFTYVGITPEKAVVACFEQQVRQNYNTWDYPSFDKHPNAVRGSATVACGDFTAIL